MTGRFADRIAVVTGGCSGIGAATARLLAAEGAKVALFDLEDRDELVPELGSVALYVTVDVADCEAVAAGIEAVIRRFGSIDILVNNAGIGCLAKTPDIPVSEWERVLAVDLNGVFFACRAAIPHMCGRGGAIVNTASISGMGGDHGFTAYNAAKGAVINYTRALAVDHAADNIRVNAVCPGLIETPQTEGLESDPDLLRRWTDGIPLKRAGTAAEVANVIAFLASDAASYVTGAIFVVDGGRTAWTGQPDATVLLSR